MAQATGPTFPSAGCPEIPCYVMGKDVAVIVDNKVLFVTNANCDVTADLIKMTNVRSNGWHEYQPGAKGAKGSCDTIVACDEPPTLAAGDIVCFFWTATIGEPATFTDDLTFTAVVSSVKRSFTPEAEYKISFDFSATGPVTYAVPPPGP